MIVLEIIYKLVYSKAKLLLEATFFYLPEVDIQVQNGKGVLGSLVPSMDMDILQVSKNDDEERCF